MLTETEILQQKKAVDFGQIHAIILLVENTNFGSLDKPYYEKICGKEMTEYLQKACENFKTSLVVLEQNAGVLQTIRPFLDESEITVVVYSNTPLISKETILEYVNTLILKDEKIVYMPKGFVAKTQVLKGENLLVNSQLNSFNKNEFFEVNNFCDLEQAGRMMQSLILNYHMQNGVRIIDRTSTIIHADAEIEKGAVIHPFCQITGKTFIAKGAQVSASTIKNCRILEGAKIENCNLVSCEVEKNALVKPFTYAKNKNLKGMK